MAFEDVLQKVINRLPGIEEPIQRLSFNARMKWTGIVLLVYLVLAQIFVYGVNQQSIGQLRFFEIILGSSFGTVMSLGIGPIVTASIILQLLVGSKIIPWDLQSDTGKQLFQGTQKLLAILFSFGEAVIFVNMGAVPAQPGFETIVIAQLAVGGILVIFLDEVIQKWGFGSGVSLFIAAGVAKQILVQAVNPLTQTGTIPGPGNPPAGAIPFAITSLLSAEPFQAFVALLPVMATVLVFLIVVYANAIRVEIPLAYGSVRGFGRRWPLKFFYTSNIPVILVAALIANVSLFGRMLGDRFSFLGTFDPNGTATGGLAFFLTPPSSTGLTGVMILIGIFGFLGAVLAQKFNKKAWQLSVLGGVGGGVLWFLLAFSLNLTSLTVIAPIDIARTLTYSGFLIIGSTIFAWFWMTTAGMGPKNVAEQIQGTGMQIPGYRRDPRIIETVLNRYIPGLAILGGAAVGLLAAYADFTGAFGTGTGLLLATMIVYQLYEQIASQQFEDMHPALRRFMGQS